MAFSLLSKRLSIRSLQIYRNLNLVRPKSNVPAKPLLPLHKSPDVFGQYSDSLPEKKILDMLPEEEGDEERVEWLPGKTTHRLWYKECYDKIKELMDQHKVDEAIEFVEDVMIKQKSAVPQNYTYNLLISGCAKRGWAKKAFRLFNQMKKRGLKVTGGTYTSLFTACALCDNQEEGLGIARRLLELMEEKGYQPNQTNYHAIIRAFGMLGDVVTAFAMVDKMRLEKVPVDTNTFNMLLHACISDKSAGFRHALVIWAKMVELHLRPSLETFNLLLRALRDCDIGEHESLREQWHYIAHRLHKELRPRMIATNTLLLKEQTGEDFENNGVPRGTELDGPSSTNSAFDMTSKSREVSLNSSDMRNKLYSKPNSTSDLMELPRLLKPKDRLGLLGGVEGFFTTMNYNGVKPNLKTLTLLLQSCSSTQAVEEVILSAAKENGVKLDTTFCNLLIHKRNKRFACRKARAVLRIMSENGVSPDMLTFGTLALACNNREDISQLIFDLKKTGFRLNGEIGTTLLNQAVNSGDPESVELVIREIRRSRVTPSPRSMKELEKLVTNLGNSSTSLGNFLYPSVSGLLSTWQRLPRVT